MRELIYNQAQIPKDKWRYGFRSSASTGCGWIAVSNALVRMGYDVDVEKLIRCFERQLPLIHGNAGTLVFGPFRLLKKWGFPVTITADPRQFDRRIRESGAGIFWFLWWNRKKKPLRKYKVRRRRKKRISPLANHKQTNQRRKRSSKKK